MGNLAMDFRHQHPGVETGEKETRYVPPDLIVGILEDSYYCRALRIDVIHDPKEAVGIAAQYISDVTEGRREPL